eukprot:12395773-Alexandrium_andersonii.AAC.1
MDSTHWAMSARVQLFWAESIGGTAGSGKPCTPEQCHSREAQEPQGPEAHGAGSRSVVRAVP